MRWATLALLASLASLAACKHADPKTPVHACSMKPVDGGYVVDCNDGK